MLCAPDTASNVTAVERRHGSLEPERTNQDMDEIHKLDRSKSTYMEVGVGKIKPNVFGECDTQESIPIRQKFGRSLSDHGYRGLAHCVVCSE